MKNKLLFLSLLSILSLSCCKKEEPFESTSTKESSSSEKEEEKSYNYRLEKGEDGLNYKYTDEELFNLERSSMSIPGVDYLVSDPYTYAFFMNEGSIRYPNEDLLMNQVILYTSNWYSRYTFKRKDDVKEYTLYKDGNNWIVQQINNNSKTFIPLNGAVLSIPTSHSLSFEELDTVTINNDSIITNYQLGFYNQNDMRIGIESVNDLMWAEKKINMYDTNTLATATRNNFTRLMTLNVVYDFEKKEYHVDKFRSYSRQVNLFTNIFDEGFVFACSSDEGKECVKLMENAFFKKDDILKAEDGGLIHNKINTLKIGTNSYTYVNGKKISFSISKSTTNTSTSAWGNEVAIDSNGYVIAKGSHVDIPKGGYKLVFTGQSNTTSEDINVLLDELFKYSSNIFISKNTIMISLFTIERVDYLWSQVTSYAETIVNDLIPAQNYDYNEEESNKCYQKLLDIREELDSLLESENGNDLYRIYSLQGTIYQIYYKLISYTNRNEAVQSKSCWYIHNFQTNDKSLESIQEHLEIIKDAGMNEIIIYAMEDGTVGYNNSKYFKETNLASKNDYGKYGNDFLKALIGEAHALNMKVLTCFCPFTSGLEFAFEELNNCKALNIEGKDKVVTSQGYVEMLDPANDLVQEKIKLAINDILECNPDLDGIQLDYIRYGADNNSINTTMGITIESMKKYNTTYKTSYNSLDAFRTDLKKGSTVFSNFIQLEQQFITNTVRNIKEVCKEYDVPLTCAIADNYSLVKTWKCQDWSKWDEEGLVDALYLMDYYLDDYYINYYFEDMLNHTNNTALLITGIDPSYASLSDEFYARTIKGGLLDYHSSGYAIFGTHTQDSKKYAWDLVKPSNWLDSISPYDSLKDIMKASSDLLIKRCENIYVKYENQSLEQKESLKQDLDKMINSINNDSYEDATNVMNALTLMLEKEYASNDANKRIKEQLEYMYQLARAKQNIYKD